MLGVRTSESTAGDSRCVLARFDTQGQLKAHMLTREHKALFPSERQRIEKAGGFVSKDGRLQGGGPADKMR